MASVKLKDASIVGASLLVLFFGTGNFWSATWLSKWALIETASLCAMCWWAAKRTSLWHLPLMLYVTLSLLRLSVWLPNPYQTTLDAITVLALEKNALEGVLALVFTLCAFARFTGTCTRACRISLSSIWLIGTVTTLALPVLPQLPVFPLLASHRPPDNGLWFGNPSMGASLLACLVPLVWESLRRKKGRTLMDAGVWAATLCAIVATKASVPWGVLGVTTASYLLSRKGLLTASLVLSLSSIGAIMIGSGSYLLGTTFFDPNGRFEIWGMAWNWFWEHGSLYFGQGFSSTQVLLPLEQIITNHFHGDYFLWLHNDWLQVLIEGGAVGFACVILSFGRLVRVSWPRPELFAALMGFATLALFNYPLRMPIHVYCLVLICGMAEALNRSERSSACRRSEPDAEKIHSELLSTPGR